MRHCTRWLLLLASVIAAGALPQPVAGQDADFVTARLEALSDGEVPASLADLQALQARLKQLSHQLIPATVNVRVGPAQGSGVIISEDGYVLTAGHVCIEPDREVIFTLHDGRQVRGKSLGMNTELDSGLMKITTEGKYPTVEWGESSKLRAGQWVIALGHPGGLEAGRPAVMRLGRVLSIDDDVISTDCTLVGGDSGGPLFDLEGRVVGINSRIGGPLTVNLHVPTDEYRRTWDRLVAGDLWGEEGERRPYIGVKGDADTVNARIAEVYSGSPAEDAGIREGDLVVRFDGERVSDFASLAALVHKAQPGSQVKVVVRRKLVVQQRTVEKELELKLVVGGRAAL